MCIMKNKRGLSQLADVIFALILFTLFFVILMFIMGTARMQVHAQINAANTAFICQNDLSATMQFPSEERQIKDILVESYEKNDYSDFDSKFSNALGKVAEEGMWETRILQGEKELHKVGELTHENSESCSVFIPIKCDTSASEDEIEYEQKLMKCNLEVQLILGYE